MSKALPLTWLESGEATGGPPLIVLHGLFGSARNWATLARRFGERRHVYALDLRNHGESPWALEMTYPDMAADVRRFLDDRGYDRAGLVGHSMGGKAAMAFALRWPERVDRLVVVDIAPVAYDHDFGGFVAAMKAADLSPGRRRADIDAQLTAAVPEPSLRSFLLQNLVAGNGGFRWRINLDAVASNLAAIVGFPDFGSALCERPALFVRGASSDYVLPAHHQAIRCLFPEARLTALDGAGHWPHAEQTEEFARVVEEFI